MQHLRSLRDLFWPASCASCAAPGRLLCPGCALAVASLGAPDAHRPSPTPTGFPPTHAWGPYAGALKQLVVAYKDAERVDLTPLLGVLLVDVLEPVLAEVTAPVLVPVPSAAAARRRRGREPVTDLIRGLRLPRPVLMVPALRVVRQVRDQAGLGQRERATNLAGSFGVVARAAPLVAGRDVILVDDVVTTGATLTEGARALRATGQVRSVRAVVLCATQRRERDRLDHRNVGRALPTPPVVH